MMPAHFSSIFTAFAALVLAGCAGSAPELVAPQVLTSPYQGLAREPIWAVVPLRNESGTTSVDVLQVSDKLVAAAAEIRGIRCLPLNRSIETMRALKLGAISGPAQARALAAALGSDGILVGTITAYDPYTPTIGISLVLYGRDTERAASFDPSSLSTATTDRTAPRRSDGVLASASEHLDGKNHQVLMDVRGFAQGRTRDGDSLGWRRYTASMHLFEEFATNFLVSRIVQGVWMHAGLATASNTEQTANKDAR